MLPPISQPKLSCTLLKPHSGEIKTRSSLKFPSNTSPVGLCVKYHVTGFSRVYCLKLRLGPAFIFQKWMPWGDREGWGLPAEYNFCDLKKSSNPLLFCTVILTNGWWRWCRGEKVTILHLIRLNGGAGRVKSRNYWCVKGNSKPQIPIRPSPTVLWERLADLGLLVIDDDSDWQEEKGVTWEGGRGGVL